MIDSFFISKDDIHLPTTSNQIVIKTFQTNQTKENYPLTIINFKQQIQCKLHKVDDAKEKDTLPQMKLR